MRLLLILLVLTVPVGLHSLSRAEEIRSIPADGSPFSYLYQIVDVVEARNHSDHVRVYEVATASGQFTSTILIQLTADARPPELSKTSLVRVWKLTTELRDLESVELQSDTIVIHAAYRKGSGKSGVTCPVRYHFEKGMLADTIDEKGCR